MVKFYWTFLDLFTYFKGFEPSYAKLRLESFSRSLPSLMLLSFKNFPKSAFLKNFLIFDFCKFFCISDVFNAIWTIDRPMWESSSWVIGTSSVVDPYWSLVYLSMIPAKGFNFWMTVFFAPDPLLEASIYLVDSRFVFSEFFEVGDCKSFLFSASLCSFWISKSF